MKGNKRRLVTIIKKLREADAMLAAGKTMDQVAQALPTVTSLVDAWNHHFGFSPTCQFRIVEGSSWGGGDAHPPTITRANASITRTVRIMTSTKCKVVRFQFTEFDTEPRTDFLYLFDGDKSNAEIMAIFSGTDIPPVLTTWRNEVLVWFVTNSENQAGGWRGLIDFIDPQSDSK